MTSRSVLPSRAHPGVGAVRLTTLSGASGLLLLLLLGGCAIGPERQALQAAGAPVELVEVPFFAQAQYHCGPAALATVLVQSGVAVTPEQLVAQVYVPDRQGSLQQEILSATRRQGRVPYLLPPRLDPMLAELQDGKPILLLENRGLDRWPVWHYAVLIGYHPAADTFVLRSGVTPRDVVGARRFLARWDRGGRWALVAAKPDAPPATAEVLGWLRAVAPFESTGELVVAEQAYRAAVLRWPEAPSAWTALGNVLYLQGELSEARSAYERALAQAPDFWAACNNLRHLVGADSAEAGSVCRDP